MSEAYKSVLLCIILFDEQNYVKNLFQISFRFVRYSFCVSKNTQKGGDGIEWNGRLAA